MLALSIGFAVALVARLGFGLYLWTAIHSGWSKAGISAFHMASLVVPLAMGLLAAWAVYRVAGS